MKKQHNNIEPEDKIAHHHLYKLGWDIFFQKQISETGKEGTPVRIVGTRRNFFIVNDGKNEKTATVSGNLLKQTDRPYPVVGDWVLLRDSLISSVLTRKNILFRKAAGSRDRKNEKASNKNQIISANIDITFVVCGLDGDFNVRRIERTLAMIHSCEITPEIILTKADLHQETEKFTTEVEAIAFGIPIHLVSADDDTTLSFLKTVVLPGKTSALIGSSGTGKSTLINRLYGEEIQATKSISKTIGKGVHTTTNRDLIILPSGGMVIDNPGIREIALSSDHDLPDAVFPDIDELAHLCKFADCTHTHEPGCAVLKGIADGQISKSRLDGFHKIRTELSYRNQREVKSASRIEKDQWKGVAKKIKHLKKGKK